MTKPLSRAFIDRLERVEGGTRVTAAELAELASYAEEVAGWCNELETAINDFEANVQMLAEGDYDGREGRRELCEKVTETAGTAAGALRALGAYLDEPVPVPA
jgi:hypothetical protein